MSPQEFVDQGVAAVLAMGDDIGDQMHRRGARGRPLVLHTHGKCVLDARPGVWSLSLRVQGQYVDRGERYSLPTQSEQIEFAAQVQQLLEHTSAPIPGEVYTKPMMGRPPLLPEQRTHPRTIWMTDAEWAKVQAAPKGWVRGVVQRAKLPAPAP